MFTIVGKFVENIVVVNWHEGVLDTTPDTFAEYLRWFADNYEGKPLGSPHMATPMYDRLSTKAGAFVIIYNALDSITKVSGDIPIFELPKDLIV